MNFFFNNNYELPKPVFLGFIFLENHSNVLKTKPLNYHSKKEVWNPIEKRHRL